MWKYAVQKTWNKRRLEEVQKVFDRQPMIMRTRIESEGKRKNFEKKMCQFHYMYYLFFNCLIFQ